MKINLKKYKDLEDMNNSKVVFIFQDKESNYCDSINKVFKCLKESGQFSGKKNEVCTLTKIKDNCVEKNVFIGLGEHKNFNVDLMRNASGKAMKEIIVQKIHSVDFYINEFKSELSFLVKAISESMVMSTYKFDKYISEKQIMDLESVNIVVEDECNISTLMKARWLARYR